MRVNITRNAEDIIMKVEDSLGDECAMLLRFHQLQLLKIAIEKFQEDQLLKGGDIPKHTHPVSDNVRLGSRPYD